jgi:hypothetical protein
MSIFNYKSQKDPWEGLASRIAKLEKILRLLKFWEVNDTSQGPSVLKRRRVTPSVSIGTVGHGEWNPITGLSNISIGTGTGGVTQITAGTLITLNPVGGTGNVTVNGTAELPASATQYQSLTWSGSAWTGDWLRWA